MNSDNDYDGLVQDCSISSAIAMEILQSCTKLSIIICISRETCIQLLTTVVLIGGKYVIKMGEYQYPLGGPYASGTLVP